MRSTRRSLLYRSTGVLAIVGVAGCLSDEDGEPEDLEIEEFEVLDRDHDGEVTVYVHGDHWHGDPLQVPHGDTLSLGAAVEDEDGDEVELGDGISLTGEVVDGAPELVSFESHGDHVHVHGDEDGLTDVVFQLTQDDRVVYETPELEVDVGDHDDDHDHDHGDVSDLTILDRNDDEAEVAEYHDGHWHGELPHVHVEENLSLGAVFEDEDGHEIPIGHDEEYELGVRVADDAETGIVSIDEDDDFHGDHVHVHGEAEGETELVFMLWHDDHADWESEPIAVEVEDH